MAHASPDPQVHQEDDKYLILKRVGVLVGLFGMLAGLQYFQTDGIADGVEPLTLASIGFTALFAFTVGELVNGIGLPRVTGYILTGVVLGPSASGFFSDPVVEEMKIFNTLALGLIATLAGLELDIKATLRVWKTLAWTVAIKVVFLIVLVGGVFVGFESYFHTFESLTSTSAIVAFGLIFAVLGIGTSPAIVLAVINDLKAKGRFSDLLLAIAVVKDVVVVVALAVAVAIAKAMLSPDSGGFDPHALVHVAKELGASIAVGMVVGALIIAYIRFVHAEMLLFVVAMILVVAQISETLHLELLLVFIVAGFLVRNFSRFEHELHHPLEVVSLPVFVVFFTVAGANLDLQKSLQVLPIALALTAARVIAFWGAGWLGAWFGGESAEVKKYAWMAYIPQAGVTLGLVTLTATRNLPEYADIILPLGMALVALNLLGGPVTLGIALKGSGEVPDAKKDTAEDVKAVEEADSEKVEEEQEEQEQLLAMPYDELDEKIADAGLRSDLRQMFEHVESSTKDIIDTQEEGLRRLFDNSLELFENHSSEEERREAVRVFGEQPVDFDVERGVMRLKDVIARTIKGLVEVKDEVVVPMEERWKDASGGGVVVVMRRLGRSLMGKRGKERHVPLRTIGRVTFEIQHLKALQAIGDARFRAEATCFDALRRYLAGELDTEKTIKTLTEERDRGVKAVRCGGMVHVHSGAQAAIWLAERADTPELSRASISYATVEPDIRAMHQELMDRPRLWAEVFGARRDGLLLKALLDGYRAEIGTLIAERLEKPIKLVEDALVRKSALISEELQGLLGELESCQSVDDDMTRTMLERTRQTFSEEMRANLKISTAEFRHHALPHHFTDALRELIEQAPEQLVVFGPDAKMPSSGPLTSVETDTIGFQEILDRQLLEEFLPELLHHHAEALELVSAVPARLSESIHVAAYAFELHLKGHAHSREPLVDSVQRSIQRVDALQFELREQCDQMLLALEQETLKTLERIAETCTPARQDTSRNRRASLARAVSSAREGLERWRLALRGLKNQERIRALRIRSGVERLSASRMREYLRKNVPAPTAVSLPPRYARLFSLAPLDDRRLFVAHREHLDELVKIEAGWRRGERSAVLITGASGSGKTTLLNMFQLEVGVNRLIRLYEDFSARHEGLLAALATELGCEPTVEALLTALGQEPGAVFISGLEHWFEPTLEGIERFKAFQNLMVRSSAQAFWVVSVQANALEMFQRLFEVEATFSHHLELDPLSWQDCRALLETRHQLSDLDWSFEHEVGWQERLTFWQAEDDNDLYFKRLHELSEGNVRSLLYHHLRTVRWNGEVISTSTAEVMEIPFLGQLPEESVVILTQLLRLGPMDRQTLQSLLMLDPDKIDLYLEHLFLAGVVEVGTVEESVVVPKHLHVPLVKELHALKRLPRGAQ